MSQKTKSELLFERFCETVSYDLRSIPTDTSKTPDYKLNLETGVVIVEIKQLDPNDSDKRHEEEFRTLGKTSGICQADDRIRRKIKKANPQLKARSEGIYPTLLVIYDNDTFDEPDATDIKTAMFGDESVTVNLDRNSNVAHKTPLSAGGNRRLTPTTHTSLSAVAHMYETDQSIELSVFHNHYASVPLDPNRLRNSRINHYSLADSEYDWTPI